MENSNYNAKIVKITELHPLEGLDRLVGINIDGNQLLVGKDTKVGDIGIYFPPESQLGENFCVQNDLIRRKDENGKAAGGMFDQNRRVRVQKFRGHQSAGFWIPVESLHYLTTDHGKYPIEGHEFSEFYGETLSQKYIPKYSGTRNGGNAQPRNRRESKLLDGQFHFHFDTSHLVKNVHRIDPKDIISVTDKWHGTSAIAAHVLCKPKLNWVQKFLIKIGIKNEVHSVYDYLYASRRVIKNVFYESDSKHFYGYDLWAEVGKQYFEGKLHKGESIYYEIVGYGKDGGFIQGPFDYGCQVGELKIVVYRITQTNADGIVTELQWNQLKERCSEIGVNPVVEFYYGQAKHLFPDLDVSEHWHEEFLSKLKETYVYDQDCPYCINKVPAEGIVVRKEGLNIECYKLKAFRFLEHESSELDKGEIDMETQESITEDEN